jgi:hypothetical protein
MDFVLVPNTSIEPSAILTINVICLVLLQTWKDYRLKWDPATFDNINVIRISDQRVWRPDIFLYNKYVNSDK